MKDQEPTKSKEFSIVHIHRGQHKVASKAGSMSAPPEKNLLYFENQDYASQEIDKNYMVKPWSPKQLLPIEETTMKPDPVINGFASDQLFKISMSPS